MTDTNAYSRAVGARLRAVRHQQGQSLEDVARKSGGRWTAAAVGSYERGDRGISAQGLAELAAFYGVPTSVLLPGPATRAWAPTGPVVLDLDVLAGQSLNPSAPLPVQRLSTWVEHVAFVGARPSRAGRFRLRGEHAAVLAALAEYCGLDVAALRAELSAAGVVVAVAAAGAEAR